MRGFLSVLVGGLSFLGISAAMPPGLQFSPPIIHMNLGNLGEGSTGRYACGVGAGSKLRIKIAEVYERAGRCSEFDESLYRAYSRSFMGRPEASSVGGFFEFHGIDWRGAMSSRSVMKRTDVNRASLAFDPSPDERERAIEDVRKRVEAAAPGEAEVFSADLFGLMEQALTPYGLSTNNLADATAVYLIEVWDAARGTDTTLKGDTAEALSRQLAEGYADAFSRDPDLRTPSNLQQQSDRYLLQAFLLSSMATSFSQPSTPSSDREAFQKAMIELGKDAFGVDMTRVRFDNSGIVLEPK